MESIATNKKTTSKAWAMVGGLLSDFRMRLY